MNVAFIGTGNIAKFHLEAFRAAQADVVAVCARGESGTEFSQRYGIPNLFRSATEMVEKAKPQALCLLTQPSDYLSLLREVKRFDLPILIEKPLGYSVADAEKLRPWLPSKVFVGQNRRFYGNVALVREKIQSSRGILAQIFLPERAKDFAHRDAITRNNWNMMNGIHGIDLLTHLVGNPKRVLARDHWGQMEHTELPRFQVAFYETEKTNRVLFMTNFDSAGGWRLHFFLPQEEIIISPFEETKIKRLSGLEVMPTCEEDKIHKPGFLNQTRCFLAGISGQEIPPDWVSFDDALNSMRVLETLFKES